MPTSTLIPCFHQGKSSFLKYAFAMALSKKISVVFCTTPKHFWLCGEEGPCLIRLSSMKAYKIPEQSLILVDSCAELPSVPHPFSLADFGGYVVQALSPDSTNWYQWTKERCALLWIMGLWTRDEISQLQ